MGEDEVWGEGQDEGGREGGPLDGDEDEREGGSDQRKRATIPINLT